VGVTAWNRKQYKTLSLKMHPDRGGDEEKFKMLKNCHEDFAQLKKPEVTLPCASK
jgi:curved DNA-binding protein CbpA